MKFSRFLLAAAAVAAVLLAAGPADASMRLRIESLGVGGVGAVVTDNGANDSDPATDSVVYLGPIGSFNITVSVGTASPGATFAGYWDAIDLTIMASTKTGGTLRVILEKDGFNTAPDGGVGLTSSVGGTLAGPAGSKVTFQSWANAGNLMPNLGPVTGPPATSSLAAVSNLPPAGSVAAYAAPGMTFSSPTFGAFANTQSTSFTKSGSYSLFSTAVITLTGGGSASFDHMTGTNPAPAGLALLAAGAPLFALGYRRRKAAMA